MKEHNIQISGFIGELSGNAHMIGWNMYLDSSFYRNYTIMLPSKTEIFHNSKEMNSLIYSFVILNSIDSPYSSPFLDAIASICIKKICK